MYMYVMMHCVSRTVFYVCRPRRIKQQHSRERKRETLNYACTVVQCCVACGII